MRGAFAAAVLLVVSGQAQAASITYEFNRFPGGYVIPQITFDVPPASPVGGWSFSFTGSTTAPDSPIALTFLTPTGPLADAGETAGTQVFSSSTGAKLDSGTLVATLYYPLGNFATLELAASPVPGQSTVTISDRYGTSTHYGDYVFRSSAAVPEPASLAMLPLGLAVVARLAWRRRHAACSQARRHPSQRK